MNVEAASQDYVPTVDLGQDPNNNRQKLEKKYLIVWGLRMKIISLKYLEENFSEIVDRAWMVRLSY